MDPKRRDYAANIWELMNEGASRNDNVMIRISLSSRRNRNENTSTMYSSLENFTDKY